MSPSPFSSLISCPTCGHPYEVTDPELLGQLVRCPKCSGLIMLQAQPEENLPENLPRTDTGEDPAASALPEQLSEANPAALPEGLHTPPPVIGGGDTGVGDAAGDDVLDEVVDGDADDDLDDDADDDIESASILLSTPFLFGLGVLAALILAIVVFLSIRLFKTAPPEVPSQPTEAANRFEPISPAAADNTAESAAENIAGAPTEEEANENFDSQGSGLSRENYGKDAPEPDDAEPDDAETGESEIADEPETDAEGPDAPQTDRSSDDTPGEVTSPTQAAENNSAAQTGEQTDPMSDPDLQPSSDSSEPIRIDPALAGQISESIDIPGQLALAIRSIQLPNKTLPELVSLIGSLANVPIQVAWETIPSPPALCSRSVTVSLEETTVGTVLEEAARLLGLNIEMLPDAVRLYIPEEAPGSKEFNIADLLASRGPSAQEPPAAEPSAAKEEEGENVPAGEPTYPILPEDLTPEVIERFLASLLPVSSQDSPTLTVDHETVKVQGPALVLARTVRVLDQLRCLRNIDSPDLLPREELIPETLAFEQLSGDMSLNFLTSVTLSEALLFFTENTSTEQTRMKGMVDTAALRQAGISLQTRMPLHCDTQPAERVLTELANGFGLTWFTPAADVVVVTTKQRVQELPTIEIHSSQDRSDGFLEKAAQLARDAGGVLWYDSVSGCVIVHADAVTQRRIEHL